MPHDSTQKAEFTCEECKYQSCCNLHLGAHKRKHSSKSVRCQFCSQTVNSLALGIHISKYHPSEYKPTMGAKPKKVKQKKEADLLDTLISEFRRMLEQAVVVNGVIKKLQESNEDMAVSLSTLQSENRRLERDNAELRGKVLNYRQEKVEIRKSLRAAVDYTPLEQRLSAEELEYLKSIQGK